jgi:cytoskeletal protein CcmA (bactofilin family)
MITVASQLSGDVRVTQDLRLLGMITGSATVCAGATLLLHGMVRGDLVLESGARADVRGVVGGNVINRGGELRVFGRVSGTLTTESGTTTIDPAAVVEGGESRR